MPSFKILRPIAPVPFINWGCPVSLEDTGLREAFLLNRMDSVVTAILVWSEGDEVALCADARFAWRNAGKNPPVQSALKTVRVNDRLALAFTSANARRLMGVFADFVGWGHSDLTDPATGMQLDPFWKWEDERKSLDATFSDFCKVFFQNLIGVKSDYMDLVFGIEQMGNGKLVIGRVAKNDDGGIVVPGVDEADARGRLWKSWPKTRDPIEDDVTRMLHDTESPLPDRLSSAIDHISDSVLDRTVGNTCFIRLASEGFRLHKGALHFAETRSANELRPNPLSQPSRFFPI